MWWLLCLVGLWGASAEPRTCEPIRVGLCSDLGYTQTGMPNLGGNELQQEAEYTLKSFLPLIQYGCSPHLKLFLCTVYVPMCAEKVSSPIGPCRGLCESVRSRCYPVLEGFGFSWPDVLNCSRFPPENNHEHMCMDGPQDRGGDVAAPVDPAMHRFACDEGRSYARNEAGVCVPLCDANELLFDEGVKNFAEVWVSVWAMICFIFSLSSALTLSIGGGRVKARPLISLALCYCMVSAGWILRMFSGRMSTNCPSDPPEPDGLSNVNCAFVFLLLYYFGMAANAWWTSLCFWWVARVGLGWSPENLRTLGSRLHIFAWGLPAVQTVVGLVKRDVDSDELTGTCYIGNHNTTTLLTLVLIPTCFYFFLGIILLAAGCALVLRKPRAPQTAPLTAPAPRKESDFLGAVCTLYAIPTFCVLASIYYEYSNRASWQNGATKPALWPFLLRHLMSLFVGVSTIFWIWSLKTVTAWRSVARRLGPRKQLPLKMPAAHVLRYVPPPQPPHQNLLGGNMSTSSRHSTRSHHSRTKTLHHMCAGETII